MAELRVIGRELAETSYYGQYLNYATFDGVRFIACDFRHVDAKLASFRDCSFVDCQFDNGNFQLTKFVHCRFSSTREDARVRNASFGSARFIKCKLYENQSIWFHECSLRKSKIQGCGIGRVSFKESSLESAEMLQCAVEEIDIAFTSCTGFVFDGNDVGRAIFSLPTMLLIIGGWNLLAVPSQSLRHTLDGVDLEDIKDPDLIREQLADQVKREIETRTSIWRIASGLVTLSYQPLSTDGSLAAVAEKLVPEIQNSDISEEQLLDELVLVLKLFFTVKLFECAFAQFCKDVRSTLRGVGEEIHPEVWAEFSELVSRYDLATRKTYSINFQFKRLSATEPDDVRTAAEVSRDFSRLVPESIGDKKLQIRNGSVVLEVLAALDKIPWWIAVAIAVGIGTKISINFDVNKMFSQIAFALTSLRKTSQKDVSDLAKSLSKQEVHLVISDLSVENSRNTTLITLSDQIRILGEQGEKGIQQVDQKTVERGS